MNANAPSSVAGVAVEGGDSSASQDLTNSASSDASNDASTTQDADQSQSSSSSCAVGCGGSGQAQFLGQFAETGQKADSDAKAKQNGVNANAPSSVAGVFVIGGDSSADQTLDNSADSSASNSATTTQGAGQSQSSSDSCVVGCGGSGQAQALIQGASTWQKADSDAKAFQNGVNANAPSSVAGVAVEGGDSSASQDLTNSASSDASNDASTTQGADQSQSSSSSCAVGCGGSGQAQFLGQFAETGQKADSDAKAAQNGVNANTPSSIAGLFAEEGDSSADQTMDNSADSSAENSASTSQGAGQNQSSSSSGSGQVQALIQKARTWQKADSDAKAKQNGVNTNAPSSEAGFIVSALSEALRARL